MSALHLPILLSAAKRSLLQRLFAKGAPGYFFDFSVLSSLYQDTAGTTPVTVSTDPIGLVQDLSGNGNHFQQGTSTKRPLLDIAAGLSGAKFDGVDDFLSSTATVNLAGFDTGITLIVGYYINGVATTRILLESSANAGSNNGTFYVAFRDSPSSLNNTSFGYRGSAIGVLSTAAIADPSQRINSCGIDATNATGRATQITPRQNGVAGSSGTGGVAVIGTGLTTQTHYMGARAGTSLFLPAIIYFAGVVGRLLTEKELAEVDTVFGAKAGQTL